MREQLSEPVPSPVVLGKISERFRYAARAVAEREQIPYGLGAGPGDHRVTTSRLHSTHFAHLVSRPALKRQDLHRLALASTGGRRVRFPLALPCFHRVTGNAP
jgi:hypothetical protein